MSFSKGCGTPDDVEASLEKAAEVAPGGEGAKSAIPAAK